MDVSESATKKPIQTFVFLDIETTNIPAYNFNKAKITEVCFISCSREDVIHTNKGEIPRTLDKLSLCFNPQMMVHPEATKLSGLDNWMLEKKTTFNLNVANMINCFLNHLEKPLCLVAHNGKGFDYPILKKSLDKLNMKLPSEILCIDTLIALRQIDKNINLELYTMLKQSKEICIKNDYDCEKEINLKITEIESKEINFNPAKMQKLNENTPKTPKIRQYFSTKPSKFFQYHRELHSKSSRRELFPSSANKKQSYKLSNIYERIFKQQPDQAHQAEIDVINLMKIAINYGEKFIDYSDKNATLFYS